jgi:hypothetical protein
MKRVFVLVAVLALLAACVPKPPLSPYVAGTPVEIVKLYYSSWAKKDYHTMYNLVSDGWKALEPTASSERRFASYMGGFYTHATSIRLVFASEQSNDGREAVVSVALEVGMPNGKFANTNQTLTLRSKPAGWKLVHPYGEHKDTS